MRLKRLEQPEAAVVGRRHNLVQVAFRRFSARKLVKPRRPGYLSNMDPSLPAVLVRLLGDDPVFKDLLARVDQTWAKVVVTSPPTAADTHQYVLAVQAVSESVLLSLQARQQLDPGALPKLDSVVSAASLAPVVLKTPRAWQAVVEVALHNASVHADLLEGLDAARKLRFLPTEEVGSEQLVLAPHNSAVITQLLSDELIDSYEPPLQTVQRVFEPRSDEELGSWLGVSRTTVADWRRQRFSPSAEHERRLETVAAIARLVDLYIHPEDQQLYLRDTTLQAFDGQTLDAVLATKGENAQQTLGRVLVLLRAALVQ